MGFEPTGPGPEFDPDAAECKLVLGLIPVCRLKDELRPGADQQPLGPILSAKLLYDLLPGTPE